MSPDRKPPAWEHVLHHLTWSLVRVGVFHRHQLSIRGASHLPLEGPAVLVANHASHLDTLLLGASLPARLRARFSPLAAGDTFFRNPLQSWLSSRCLNLRPLWRNRLQPHALQRLRESLVEQQGLFLLFPEGTRSRDGEMGRFKPGIGMLVAGTPIPVVPCHIRGTHQAWPADHRLPSRGKLELRIGRPQCFADAPAGSGAWRDIAHRLEDAVVELGRSTGHQRPGLAA
ncbi:lysophospholipid acyltransferase family protein [Haloferula sp. A504]|uniref:lysophospholipid acyltransferase family protein n=1 Tax=Haloferula sp. A504 TaxID=3373601 RepID=UPI0031CA8CC6|nr:1-acyl-sn-glycerol-3-phosphate acyltransferase [Verrucomicrobiaceae bacterium E54]